MFTILPFETEFYKKHNYSVNYVGNPSVDAISKRPNQAQTREEFCIKNSLSAKPILALLPGSRKQEITSCLPRMLKAASHFTDFQIVISGAPGVEKEFYNHFLEQTPTKTSIVFGQTYDLVVQADAAVVNSGTAVLEVALLDTPQVVVYHVALGKFGMLMKDLFLKIKYVTLVNLIADKEIVKELLAHEFTVENIEKELNRIINDKAYLQKMKSNYQAMREKLGGTGASEKAAKAIFEALQ